jgi:hypothetical protein
VVTPKKIIGLALHHAHNDVVFTPSPLKRFNRAAQYAWLRDYEGETAQKD